jgi:hypothetical protein
VFLALALGLLLGTIVVERGIISDQQTTLVAGLQKDFDQIRTESAAIKKANTALTAFTAEVAPRIAEGALAGRLVLVIASPDTGDTVADVTTSVRSAGGRTAVATFTDPGLSLSDPAVATAATEALTAAGLSGEATSVIATLAREWSTPGDARALTKALVSAGGLKLTGLPATATVDAVVVSAVFAGKPDASAFALARGFAGRALPVVGVEIANRPDGTAVAAKAAGMSGVDNVDTPVGSVSLVWVLAGRAAGLYGSGATVDSPYPSPLFLRQ